MILATSSVELGGRQADIALSRADRNQQIDALVAMGLEDETAREIVLSRRGHLNLIRRHPRIAVDYQRPDWAYAENTRQLIAPLLCGAWTADNKNDCEKLGQLANTPYDEYEQYLHKWAIADDRPVLLVGNIWQVTSRQDAWSLLSPFVDANVLQRFGRIVGEVLREKDPRLELPPEERWMANAFGKTTTYSKHLRHGLAEMLAILASYGDRDCRNVGSRSVQDQVSYLVKGLLIENMSGERFSSLSKELPLLAEAAPEIFLEAVETGLPGSNPPVMDLFVEEGDMGGCPHAGLLWGLEAISWNLDYLARVVGVLAKLASMDPGGRYSNRPSNTLREIFRRSYPQTKATLDERLVIIDSLVRQKPKSGWKLLLDLLPTGGPESITPIHRPYFREWDAGWEKGTTTTEYYQHVAAIADRILKHVREEPNTRWIEVIDKMSQLPKELFDRAIVLLESDLGKLSESASKNICDKLRMVISRHREYSHTKWALPKESIDQLDEVYRKLIPGNVVIKYEYLFRNGHISLPNIPFGLDYHQKQELIEQARIDALDEIWHSLGFSGIEHLASLLDFPWFLGISLTKTNFAGEIEDRILSWLKSERRMEGYRKL